MYTKTNKEIYRFKVFQETAEKEVDAKRMLKLKKKLRLRKLAK